MTITRTEFPGLLIIEPKIFADDRGYFFESFNKAKFEQESGFSGSFVQHNQSCSVKGTVRGLHFQREPFAQAKLARVLSGRVLDVAVDLREGSPTFGKSFSYELDDVKKKQLYIPKGFAHGFVVLSDTAEFFYCVDSPYAPDYDDGIRFDDPALGIDWVLAPHSLILSEKDLRLADFKNSIGKFKY